MKTNLKHTALFLLLCLSTLAMVLGMAVVVSLAASPSVFAAESSIEASRAVSYTYYLPYFISDPDYWQGVALSNCSATQTANAVVNVYGQDGVSLATVNKTLLPMGEDAFLVGEGLDNEGWIVVTSDQPLTGLCFFGPFSPNKYMADITLLHDKSSSLHIPHVAQNDEWDTIVLIGNPNATSTTVTLTYYSKTGEAGQPESHTIAGNGSGRYPLTDLIGATATAHGGKVVISATQAVVAFALYNDIKYGESMRCYTGISGVDPADQPRGTSTPFD